MRRLLALVVLVLLVGLAVYYWRNRPAELQSAREALESVGDTLRATKAAGGVKAALELDRELKSYPIDVDAGGEEGVVILRGEVPSDALRSSAERVAAAVPDVRSVLNELRVNPTLAPPAQGDRTLGESLDDRTLEAKVRLAFSLNRELKGTDIEVQSHRRQVTLSGQVGTPAQRQLAVEIARRTTDVAGVTDQIGVGGQAPSTSPASGAGASPEQRVRAAEQALAANPSLAPYRLKVAAEDGRFVLSGRVKTSAEKDLAALLVRDAVGGSVDNRVAVGP